MKHIIFFIFFFCVNLLLYCADGNAPQSLPSAVETKTTKTISLRDIKTIEQIWKHLHATKSKHTYSIQDVIDTVTFCSEEGTQKTRKKYILNQIKLCTNPTLEILHAIITIAAKAPEKDDVVNGHLHIRSIFTLYADQCKTLDSRSDKDVH